MDEATATGVNPLTEGNNTKFSELAVASKRHDIELCTPSFVEGIQCEEVTIDDIDEAHLDLTKRMLKFLTDVNALGLAAAQLGIEKRFFVFWDKRLDPRVRYNPKYFASGGKATWVEKCLTYGDRGYAVKRHKNIQAVWWEYDPESKSLIKKTKRMSGIDAQVFQHETDHLNGKTIATQGYMVRPAE